MKNQVCTIEQMKALKELGVDISKASMCYVDDKDSIDNLTFKINEYSPSIIKEYSDLVFPVFTVTDMIELMPYSVLDEHCDYYYFDLLKLDKSYTCFYRYITGVHIYHSGHCRSLIEAVYKVFFNLAKAGKL